jgi:raffinose/stachyose/melibiose transport system substrate-binding protein
MTAWQFYLGSNTCDTRANDNLATDTAPWSPGKEQYQIDSLLYNVVHAKVTEADPTTTNWENSKNLIGTGQVATMMLASWAISQMQDAATKAGKDPATIGFMPWPVQVGGHFCAIVQPDYLQAVSIHSAHKEAARAWLDWFVDRSPYARDQGLLPTLKSGQLPPALQAYQDGGVQFVELSQAKNALVTKIDNQSEIGLQKPDYRQHIVDLARGAAGGSLDADFADLNRKWADAIKTVGS